ncbi:MAG: tetratricopeptide repeat protein [Thermoanaerobaculia bacterium]
MKAAAKQASSASEKLAIARRLSMQMTWAEGPLKFDLFAQTWANLELVRKAWPNDRNAVVQSGIMQADMASGFNLWPKSAEILLEILPAAVKTDAEPQVEEKLGQAYDQSGNPAEAEKHLLAAERAMHRVHPNRVESESILSTIGMFYTRQNKPLEAIQRFREAGALPGQDIVNRMQFQLSVVKQAARLGNDAGVPEFARFDDLIRESQRTPLSPEDATQIRDMKQHAQRIRDASHR